ncbi:MAG: aminoacetone oxidase family FAD-binding enzyme [Candidatus Scalindua sp.]
MKSYEVVIIGAGAAGLMCALTAGQRGRKILVLDHAGSVSEKILISGGGSCNFTNLYLGSEHYISGNPHFCKSALSRFSQYDFISLVEKHGVSYHERKSGQLFCDGKSKEILNFLLEECRIAGVRIQTKCTIRKIEKEQHFTVKTNSEEYVTESLVVATGGLSMPETGATGFGYKVAEVTRGGGDTEDLSSKTFEARNVKGLYFIGEVVDVAGWLGGYNLQWAWSSGFCAGQFV